MGFLGDFMVFTLFFLSPRPGTAYENHGKIKRKPTMKTMNNHRKMEVYPLVNVYITMERSSIFEWERSTISTGPFSSAM